MFRCHVIRADFYFKMENKIADECLQNNLNDSGIGESPLHSLTSAENSPENLNLEMNQFSIINKNCEINNKCRALHSENAKMENSVKLENKSSLCLANIELENDNLTRSNKCVSDDIFNDDEVHNILNELLMSDICIPDNINFPDFYDDSIFNKLDCESSENENSTPMDPSAVEKVSNYLQSEVCSNKELLAETEGNNKVDKNNKEEENNSFPNKCKAISDNKVVTISDNLTSRSKSKNNRLIVNKSVENNKKEATEVEDKSKQYFSLIKQKSFDQNIDVESKSSMDSDSSNSNKIVEIISESVIDKSIKLNDNKILLTLSNGESIECNYIDHCYDETLVTNIREYMNNFHCCEKDVCDCNKQIADNQELLTSYEPEIHSPFHMPLLGNERTDENSSTNVSPITDNEEAYVIQTNNIEDFYIPDENPIKLNYWSSSDSSITEENSTSINDKTSMTRNSCIEEPELMRYNNNNTENWLDKYKRAQPVNIISENFNNSNRMPPRRKKKQSDEELYVTAPRRSIRIKLNESLDDYAKKNYCDESVLADIDNKDTTALHNYSLRSSHGPSPFNTRSSPSKKRKAKDSKEPEYELPPNPLRNMNMKQNERAAKVREIQQEHENWLELRRDLYNERSNVKCVLKGGINYQPTVSLLRDPTIENMSPNDVLIIPSSSAKNILPCKF